MHYRRGCPSNTSLVINAQRENSDKKLLLRCCNKIRGYRNRADSVLRLWGDLGRVKRQQCMPIVGTQRDSTPRAEFHVRKQCCCSRCAHKSSQLLGIGRSCAQCFAVCPSLSLLSCSALVAVQGRSPCWSTPYRVVAEETPEISSSATLCGARRDTHDVWPPRVAGRRVELHHQTRRKCGVDGGRRSPWGRRSPQSRRSLPSPWGRRVTSPHELQQAL